MSDARNAEKVRPEPPLDPSFRLPAWLAQRREEARQHIAALKRKHRHSDG